jgi:predicted DNA-binding transcriptional regulator YafY
LDPHEFEPLEADDRHRCSDAELADREAAALELLAIGTGTALTSQMLAERFGVSIRQARRYVRAAALELHEPLTTAELDAQAAADLYRLDLIAGRAMAAGDESLAIRATRAHASALAQLRKAFEPAGPQRVRLRTARTRPELIG